MILGFRIYVSSELRIYDDSLTRAMTEGGSKKVYKDDQVYFVFLDIIKGRKIIQNLNTASWSMIIETLDGKVLLAKNFKHTTSSIQWNWEYSVPRIDDEKEIKLTIVIKS